MKRSRRFWLGFALSMIMLNVGLISCKKSNNSEPEPSGPATVKEANEWVETNMRDVYYWSAQIPAKRNLNFSSETPTFFDALLHPDDRFSWIQKADDLVKNLSGVSTTVGIGIELLRWSRSSEQVVITVKYTLTGAPAALAGIERGDFITKINGRALTLTNYQDVLEPYYGAAPYSVEISKLIGDQLITQREVTLRPVENFQEQSIHLDTILTLPSGKKVAYLFYNKFLNAQTDALLAAFGRFKQAQASDLILDLRYNPGGGIAAAGFLSGLIQKDFEGDEVFVQYKYNSNYRESSDKYIDLFGGKSEDLATRNNANQIIAAIKSANLNLSRVYVLATENSASASELVINNLRPFLGDQQVIHIGQNTVGKNEGSITIIDERKPRRIDWGMQPIVVKLANKQGYGDYPNGLSPQHTVDEWEFLPFVPFGSDEDPLLARALVLIEPSLQAKLHQKMSVRKASVKGFVPDKIPFEDPFHRIRPVHLDKFNGRSLNILEQQ